MTKLIHLIDDDVVLCRDLADHLRFLNHEVVVSHNGSDGIDEARRSRPDLIILDVNMKGIDGFETCKRIRSSDDDKVARTPIIMLTHYAAHRYELRAFTEAGVDDFVAKPFDLPLLEARIETLLRRTTSPPYVDSRMRQLLELSCKSGARVEIRVGIAASSKVQTKEILVVPPHGAMGSPSFDWRTQAKRIGQELYSRLFDMAEVTGQYERARSDFGEDFRIKLSGPRDLLATRFEFMHPGDHGNYLALKHPFSRAVEGVRPRHSSIGPEFLNSLWPRRRALRVLLVASNVYGTGPGGVILSPTDKVDDEIEFLQTAIRDGFDRQGIRTQLDVVHTKDATHDRIEKLLTSRRHDIFHYAGHAFFRSSAPEDSGLFLWDEGKSGAIKVLTARALQSMVEFRSPLRLVYLSTCEGTATAETSALAVNDFLGLADALIQAGIPGVLGYHWPVSDEAACQMAMWFYESLARQAELDVALRDARKALYSKDPKDPTWLSPVLVMNG